MVQSRYPFYVYISKKTFNLFGCKVRVPWVKAYKGGKNWITDSYEKDDSFEPCYDYDYDEEYYRDRYDEDDYYADHYCYDDDDEDFDEIHLRIEQELSGYRLCCGEEDEEKTRSWFDPLIVNNLLLGELIIRDDGYGFLATKHVLIADIDCGHDIQLPLAVLQSYVERFGGCFYAYKTLNGLRYIQSDVLYQSVNRSAVDTLKYLGSDEKYIELCRRDGRFKARVTPKSSKENAQAYLALVQLQDLAPEVKICEFLGTFGEANPSDVAKFILWHDTLCSVFCSHASLA